MAKFTKGRSGNPTGKKPGTKDRRTELRELLKPRAPELLQMIVEQALAGDMAAAKLVIDRVCPPVKAVSEPLQSKLPTTGSLAEQGAAIYQAAANGEISLDEAAAAMQVLQGQVKIIETTELIERLGKLEQAQQGATDEQHTFKAT